jgi:hypothetical protein
VAEICVRDGVRWRWDFLWRRLMFQWEENMVDELIIVIERGHLSPEEDRWDWKPNCEGLLSVKSAYEVHAKDSNF